MSLCNHRTPRARRHSKLVLFFLSSLSSTGIAFIAQQRYVAGQHGFGAGDTPAFMLWLVQLSVVVGIVAVALGSFRCRLWLRLALSVIVGVVGGYAWTWWGFFNLGAWFGAFSFPLLHFFMLGAVVGLLLGSVYVSLCGKKAG